MSPRRRSAGDGIHCGLGLGEFTSATVGGNFDGGSAVTLSQQQQSPTAQGTWLLKLLEMEVQKNSFISIT